MNIYYRSVKVIFNFAIRNEYIFKSPFSKSSQLKVPQKIPVYMTSEELQKLLAVVDEQKLKDIFKFAALTGLRLNEITNMKWIQVDFKKKQITVENSDTFVTNSGRIRTVPMHDAVIEILQKLQNNKTSLGYVFVKKSGWKYAGTYVSHKLRSMSEKQS